MLKIFGKKKILKPRCIRSFERIAQKQYSCWNCDIPIFPGDRYGGNVIVFGKTLFVKRFHMGCPIDPREDEKERTGYYQKKPPTKKVA